MLRHTLRLVATAGLLVAAAAEAQPRPGAPTVGTLAAADAPVSLAVEAGGSDRNPVPGSGCSGFIRSGAPLAAVEHTGGPLAIYVTSGTDTTLLVGDPSGRWQCSDDANGINPAVIYANAAAGTYAVWVGTFSAAAAGAAATVHTVRGQPRW